MLAGHAVCKDCGNGTLNNLLNEQFLDAGDDVVVCSFCGGYHVDGELFEEELEVASTEIEDGEVEEDEEDTDFFTRADEDYEKEVGA